MIHARYRHDYPGEFVIISSTWTGGRKKQVREWIDNPIQNQHISGRAVCIGSDAGVEMFDHTHLSRHRGGILGSQQLQTYGTADIAQQMRLDFAVSLDKGKVDQLVQSGYTIQNIVYTNASNCLRHPGVFYLVPQMPYMCSTVLPLYLAAFDGHEEIFCIGYSNDTIAEVSGWQNQISQLIEAYPGVLWTFVGAKNNTPKIWLAHPNVRTFTAREFVGHCDI